MAEGMFFKLAWPFVRQTCEHNILKTHEPILLQIGTTGPRGKGVKRETLGVRMSKVKGQDHRMQKLDMEASFSTSLGHAG